MAHIIDALITLSEKQGDTILFADKNQSCTVKEALQSAYRISAYLHDKKIENQAIFVSVSRTIETPLLFFGIAASGNYYVPVLSDTPKEKLEKMVSATHGGYLFEAEPLLEKGNLLPSLSKEEALAYPKSEPALKKSDNHALYLVFTSGSTGTPKGVLKSHDAMLRFMENFTLTFPFLKKERIANQTPFSFDASAKDIYLSIQLGATLFIPERSVFALPGETLKYLKSQKITMLIWVPSALSMISKVKALNFETLPDLRYVFFVGEAFPAKYLNYWIEKLPDVRYFNIYGSSEVAGVSLYHEIKGPQPLDKPIPTGKGLANNHVSLLDGEILIQSEQVALGYINDEEKDRRTFDRSTKPTTLHTGDYAVYNEEGDIVFETRKDFQIKHLGYRIELQEIEVAALSLPYIENCCCLYDNERDKIVMVLVSNQSEENWKKPLLDDLGRKVASYMLPNKLVRLDKMPLNPNGKIDRVKIKKEVLS